MVPRTTHKLSRKFVTVKLRRDALNQTLCFWFLTHNLLYVFIEASTINKKKNTKSKKKETDAKTYTTVPSNNLPRLK